MRSAVRLAPEAEPGRDEGCRDREPVRAWRVDIGGLRSRCRGAPSLYSSWNREPCCSVPPLSCVRASCRMGTGSTTRPTAAQGGRQRANAGSRGRREAGCTDSVVLIETGVCGSSRGSRQAVVGLTAAQSSARRVSCAQERGRLGASLPHSKSATCELNWWGESNGFSPERRSLRLSRRQRSSQAAHSRSIDWSTVRRWRSSRRCPPGGHTTRGCQGHLMLRERVSPQSEVIWAIFWGDGPCYGVPHRAVPLDPLDIVHEFGHIALRQRVFAQTNRRVAIQPCN